MIVFGIDEKQLCCSVFGKVIGNYNLQKNPKQKIKVVISENP